MELDLPDVSVGKGLYGALTRLLAERGSSLLEWVDAHDPKRQRSQHVFLQFSSMGLLKDAFDRDPSLPGKLPRYLLPDTPSSDSHDWVRIGGFMETALRTWPAESRKAFLEGLASETGQLVRRESVEDFASVVLTHYGPVLKPEDRELLRKAARNDASKEPATLSPTDVLGGPGKSALRGLVAFDDFGQYLDFVKTAAGRGYAAVETGSRMSFAKGPARFEVTVQPKDESAKPAWESGLKEKARGLQFIALRGEPWFMRHYEQRLSDAGPKLVFLGACYSAWDATRILDKCPDCVVIANIGTGRYLVNNEVLFSVLDALVQGKDWKAVGDSVRKALPQRQGEVVGPWHLGYALNRRKRLRQQRLRAAEAANGSATEDPPPTRPQ